MSERVIHLDLGSPLEFYGPGDIHLNTIKSLFPKLKIIVRGDLIKLIGTNDEINLFEKRLDLLLVQFDKFGKINEDIVTKVMGEEQNSHKLMGEKESDVLVFGKHGKLIKALTINQKRMVESSEKNDLMFAIGPAGTGKTYTAVALAVRALKDKQVKKLYWHDLQ